MRVSVGRVVHYVSYGTPVRKDGSQAFVSTCRAAMVTEVSETHDLHIGLVAINPTGLFFHALADGGCDYEHPDNGPGGVARGGTWHWPERVED